MAKRSVLFVCLGNICRSPIAEAVMKQLVEEKGIAANWVVDSAATSTYEIGNSPDYRGQKCMKRYNIYHHVENHRSRQITKKDFDNFEFIFGMDDSNMSNIKRVAPKNHNIKILKLGTFDNDKSFGETINDPYYSRNEGDFDVVYNQCKRSCKNFLESLC